MTKPLALGLLAAVAMACGGTPTFRDQSIVWRVDDRRDIPEPEETEYWSFAYMGDVFLMRRLTRWLEIREREPAHNTNALDEVPDSSWFTNRIGVRQVSPEEAALGPAAAGPPQLPITVVRGKGAAGGGNPGFFAEDATGRTFLIKFDTLDNPEMQTATSVIVNRFFWTIGYNVPADTVFEFGRDELLLSPEARTQNELRRKVPMTWEDVEEVLATSPPLPDGRFRASASEFLSGVPSGPFAAEGTRDDDPNDVVPHEHRRELRGLRVFAAWLGHTDMKEDNTLDMYVEDDGRHYLRHYLLDFGEALGAHQAEKHNLADGWENRWDWQYQTYGLLSLGLWTRPWEYQVYTRWPAVGAFSAEWFEPDLWREAYPYWPFMESDVADRFWGAKIVMRFDRELVEAIVARGRLTDPVAEAYLVDALMGRRERIGQAWLEAVTPLDDFTISEAGLCAVDLGVHYDLAGDSIVERLPADYRPMFDDENEERQDGIERYRAEPDGSVCLPIPDSDDYVIDRLRVRRGSELKPVMQVHFIGGANPRILGIIRVEDT